MLNRRPEPIQTMKPFVTYCDRVQMPLKDRMQWECIGKNDTYKHIIYRRNDGQVMLLTEGGKRISENTALCEAVSVLRDVLKRGAVEDAMLPRATK